MKKIALIGSTGSIGKQTLSVVRRHPDKFEIVSIAAGTKDGDFLSQVNEFNPKVATLAFEPENIKQNIPKGVEFYSGEDAFLSAIIPEADIVLVALVGFKGILAVLKAIELGKDIALANKESLVVGGELVMQKAREKGVNIMPVDSEHSAIWQALNFDTQKEFKKIILTCSGGAFRDLTKQQLKTVTAKQALLHPNWKMGAKITVDCATLVNKAFEVIEAKWLYNTSFDKISVIIHRESIIHSMVEFKDNSVMAQLSYPSMELPITLALTKGERIDAGINSLDFKALSKLSFEEIDNDRFPCFDLVCQCAKVGGTIPAVINGANEQAVNMFLSNKITYTDIYKGIYGAVQSYFGSHHVEIDHLIEADTFGRVYVKELFGE